MPNEKSPEQNYSSEEDSGDDEGLSSICSTISDQSTTCELPETPPPIRDSFVYSPGQTEYESGIKPQTLNTKNYKNRWPPVPFSSCRDVISSESDSEDDTIKSNKGGRAQLKKATTKSDGCLPLLKIFGIGNSRGEKGRGELGSVQGGEENHPRSSCFHPFSLIFKTKDKGESKRSEQSSIASTSSFRSDK